MTYELIRTV